MNSLYDIASEYRAAAEKLADLDLDAETIADTLEALSGELEVKAQNVAYFIRNLEVSAAAIKDAEAKMAARRKAIENRVAGLQRYVHESMNMAGVSRIESPHFVVSIRDNPPAVDVFEPGLLPAEFMKTPEPPPPAPDKTAIKAAIKSGREVPGARLTQGTRLVIA